MLLVAIIGFVFGFVGSMPVAGPIAALVFARSLAGDFRSGLLIAVGGAISESIYAFLAFWGFASILAEYPVIVPVSRAVAAALLLILGVVFIRHRGPVERADGAEADSKKRSDVGSFVLGFTICALNPALIATWTAASTTLFSTGLVDFDPSQAPLFSISACVGIVGWFSLLIQLVSRFRRRFEMATLTKVIHVTGWLLLPLAAFFAWRALETALT